MRCWWPRATDCLLDKGYGAADLEWDIANTPTTRFRIGSLGKQFTAAAILLLEERGRLKLTDPVKTWWPDAPASWDRITLFNLLTQTSGIPDYAAAPDFGDTMRLQRTPAAADRRRSATSRWTSRRAGTLAAIPIPTTSSWPQAVEKAERRALTRNSCRTTIFTPLGMADSGYDTDGRAAAPSPRRYSRPERRAPFTPLISIA